MHYEKFADGTIKCIEDEIPFGIPESWCWTRINTITEINPRNLISDEMLVSFVPMALIEDGYKNSHTSDPRKWKQVKSGFTHFKNGDIGIAKITPCFENKKSVIFNNLTNGYGAGTTELHILRVLNGFVFAQYLLWIFKTDKFIDDGINAFSGAVGQKRIGKDFIASYLIPLPSYKEQVAISSKISSIFNKVSDIEKCNLVLLEDIKLTKSKILDLAIRGKLVPQDPNDEPASVLLERIKAEKEELIKQGKIKRDKAESTIFKGDDNSYYEKVGDDIKCIDCEIPFDLPHSWIWARLKTCCNTPIKRGKAPKYISKSNTLVFAQKCNTKSDDINLSLAQFLDESTLIKYSQADYLQHNDIVINSTGTGTLGRVGLYSENDNRQDFNVVPDSHISVVRITKELNAEIIYFWLKLKQPVLEHEGEGSTNQKELRSEYLSNILIPIPPFNEQRRIVDQIKTIIQKLKNIEESINN